MPAHHSPLATHGFFVTGTDTGVGKTLIACALLRAYVAAGYRAVGMKPVVAGAERQGDYDVYGDVEQLAAAGNVAAARELVNPYAFRRPIAPHIAAADQNVAIDLSRIERSFRALADRSDVVVVEGAGGFRVPLGPATDTAELARRLDLPVVLVVGMRLGCLNHALLTADSISAHGLRLAGWVANHVDADMDAADENVAALEGRLPARLLARVRHAKAPAIDTVAHLFTHVVPRRDRRGNLL